MTDDLGLGLIVGALTAWLDDPEPGEFPYDAVVAEYHRTGKHFVPDRLLEALALARKALPDRTDPSEDTRLLREFLRSALDKWDGCYEYTTYLALGLLPMPKMDDRLDLGLIARQCRDRLMVQLAADEISFELASAEGRTAMLPAMRPAPHVMTRRCRLAMHAATPALQRLGLDSRITARDPNQAAQDLCGAVLSGLPTLDRRILQLSILPVYVHHDEYLFIRVLQMFETTFALLATMLNGAIHALTEDAFPAAIQFIDVAESTLRESVPMFSLLATMQPESFLIFREFTVGASAIQSRNYKIVESLCRKPDAGRLDSAAYLSVPEVRKRVLAGSATLDDAFRSASSHWLTEGQREMLNAAMGRFSATLMKWRHTHYLLAARMLGERTGTGYTEGPPYLKLVQTIPVFQSIEHLQGGDSFEWKSRPG